MNFLVLLAVYMDANRNYAEYLKPTEHQSREMYPVESENWREKLEMHRSIYGLILPDILATEFAAQIAHDWVTLHSRFTK